MKIITWTLILTSFLFASCSSLGREENIHEKNLKSKHSDSTGILHVEDIGKGDTILLIHGFGASTYSWRYLIPELSKKYRVISIDLKGFGKSKKPYDNKYSIHDQAELIFSLLKKMKLKNVSIVGHSYGGGVALATTVLAIDNHLEMIEKLILIDGIAYRQKMPLFIKILKVPLLNKIGVGMIPPKMQVKSILKLAYYDDSKIKDSYIDEYSKPLHYPEGRYATIKVAEQIVPDNIDSFSKRYQEIKKPTLIIWGEKDEIVPVKVGRRLHSNIKNSIFSIIKDSGHAPQEETPDKIISLIMNFLSR